MSEVNSKAVSFKLEFHWTWLVPIFLLSFALAIPHFMQDAVWFDEAYTHLYSGTGRVESMPLTRSLILIAQTDPWPPGYYLLNIAWGQLTGRSPFTDYVLPALIGLVAISIIFQLAKQFYDVRAGVIISLLVASSAFFIHYTHEARAYTLYLAMISLVFWFYWKLLTRTNYRRRWLRWGFPLSIAAALYTHYVAGAFVLGVIVYHVIFERRAINNNPLMSPKRWADILRLWINGCLLFTPWFAMLLATVAAESADDRALPFHSLLGYALYAFSNNLWLIFALLVLASLLFWQLRKVRFLWTVLLVSLVFVFIVNLFASFLFHPRHILPYAVMLMLLAIPALDAIDQRLRGLSALFVAVWVGFGIAYSLTPDFMYNIPSHIEQIPLLTMNDMQAATKACVTETDAIIFSVDDPETEGAQAVALQYYFVGEVDNFSQIGQLITSFDDDKNVYLEDDAAYLAELENFTSTQENIWLMAYPENTNANNILRLNSYMDELSYLRCPILSQYENADIWAYTQADSCEAIVSGCGVSP